MSAKWSCPMHPEVESDHADDCPSCGMALERVIVAAPARQYTCPMHPEIIRDEPGDCPICGMALEPVGAIDYEEEDSELINMTLRFWVNLVFTVPVFLIAMGDLLPGQPVSAVLHTAIRPPPFYSSHLILLSFFGESSGRILCAGGSR